MIFASKDLDHFENNQNGHPYYLLSSLIASLFIANKNNVTPIPATIDV